MAYAGIKYILFKLGKIMIRVATTYIFIKRQNSIRSSSKNIFLNKNTTGYGCNVCKNFYFIYVVLKSVDLCVIK